MINSQVNKLAKWEVQCLCLLKTVTISHVHFNWSPIQCLHLRGYFVYPLYKSVVKVNFTYTAAITNKIFATIFTSLLAAFFLEFEILILVYFELVTVEM